ncbi:MAG: ribonuclease P protein component [Anaerolineae bacterium]
MERKYRLRLNADFQRVRQKGQSWVNRLTVLCALPNGLEHSRFGFAVSKRIGKAVVRNRVRRRMREAVRLCRSSIADGWDLVFIARPAIRHATYAEIVKAIEDNLRKANLYENNGNGSR